MAENINGSTTLLGTGGRVWLWQDRSRTSKSVGSAGLDGEFSQVTQLGGRAGVIAGRDGQSGAILSASGESKAAADSAINALEAAIEAYCDSGEELTWEDDQGHTGSALRLANYQRIRQRIYFVQGATCGVWQFYRLEIYENIGSF